MKQIIFTIAVLITSVIETYSQIGYQVALINRANGEPRANETVNISIRITDNAGNTICSETKSETSNEFGILSMTVGSSNTFSNIDWSNKPFYIEASVDDVLIGKSQLLSVPIAEHANHYGTLSKEILTSKTWTRTTTNVTGQTITESFTFHPDGTYNLIGEYSNKTGEYFIVGDTIIIINSGTSAYSIYYIPERGILFFNDDSGPIYK